jgi:hypothetical protein
VILYDGLACVLQSASGVLHGPLLHSFVCAHLTINSSEDVFIPCHSCFTRLHVFFDTACIVRLVSSECGQ